MVRALLDAVEAACLICDRACLICGRDCLIYGLICGRDCLIYDRDCFICAIFARQVAGVVRELLDAVETAASPVKREHLKPF